jgi:hypothetical protein
MHDSKKPHEVKTLDDFIRSEYFMAWDEENRSPGGCGIILGDQDRFDRIQEAAEDGAEGSTHNEESLEAYLQNHRTPDRW